MIPVEMSSGCEHTYLRQQRLKVSFSGTRPSLAKNQGKVIAILSRGGSLDFLTRLGMRFVTQTLSDGEWRRK